jgi:hypothetical protein
MIFSVEEGADVGRDGETPVIEDYGIAAPHEFTGKIEKVTIDLKDAGKPGEAQPNRGPVGSARKAATAG